MAFAAGFRATIARHLIRHPKTRAEKTSTYCAKAKSVDLLGHSRLLDVQPGKAKCCNDNMMRRTSMRRARRS